MGRGYLLAVLALVFIGPGDDEASQHLVYVLIVALVDILYAQPTLWLLSQQNYYRETT